MEPQTALRKSLVRTMYDIQHMRVQTGNRICAEIKVRLGQKPGQSEEALEKKARQYLEDARKEYSRLADLFVLTRASQYLKADFAECQVVTDTGMLVFMELYEKQLEHEEKMVKVIAKLVERHPLWEAFLKDIKGCGALMSAVMLVEFDIHKAERVSQFWKYCGLDVAADGRGRSRRAEHLVEKEYIDRDGNKAKRNSVTFNPFLKTKMVGVLGGSFLRDIEWSPCDQATYDAAPEDRRKLKKVKGIEGLVPHIIVYEGKYRLLYLQCRHRLENHARYGIANEENLKLEAKARKHKYSPKLHRHRMAMRWMVKMFLQDLWLAWREVEGLPVTKPYNEAVLDHQHHAA